MSKFESGDKVVLKSGGPIMTIDTVNTDIFDDGKVTGLLCVWFVGNRMERVRFDHRAVDRVPEAEAALRADDVTGDYTEVIEEMVAALNTSAGESKPAARQACKQPCKQTSKRAPKPSPRRKPAVKPNRLAGSAINH